MKAVHYLNRALGMNRREIAFRLERLVRLSRDRVRPSYVDAGFVCSYDLDDGSGKYWEVWQQKENFFFKQSDRPRLQAAFESCFPHYLSSMVAEAEAICRLDIEIFGTRFQYRQGFNWHADPRTGQEWPRRHWSKISVVDDSYPMDVKWIWELNRHQFLLPVAIAFWHTRDERYAAFILQTVESWIRENPPGSGVNWLESQELSFRLVVWVWVLELLRGSESLNESSLQMFLDSLTQQACHVYRYPSFYVSPNTHLIGEAFGLYFFASIYKEGSKAEGWLAFAREVLDNEFRLQLGADGVHRELSTYYHCYFVDYLAHYLLLADMSGYNPPAELADGLHRATAYLQDVIRPDGSLPMLGDGDGGRLLPLAGKGYRKVGSLIACAGLVGGGVEPCELNFPECTWLASPSAAVGPQATVGARARIGVGLYREASQIVHHFGERGQHQLIFKAGKMGFLSAGHSHADYCHFELSVNGAPFLVDPGTFSYKDQAMRQFARSSQAHNTVVIDDRSQLQPRGNFGWQNLPAAATVQLQAIGSNSSMQAAHRCYEDIEHGRSIIVAFDEMLICTDRFRAEGSHHYSTAFHLAPNVEVEQLRADNFLLSGPSGKALLLLADTSKPESLEGGGNGFEAVIEEGQHFPSYGETQQAQVIRKHERAHGDHVSHAVLLLYDHSADPGRADIRSGVDRFGYRIAVSWGERENIFRYNPSQSVEQTTGEYLTDARQVVEMYEQGRLVRMVLTDLRSLELGGKPLLEIGGLVEMAVAEKRNGSWRCQLCTATQSETNGTV